MDEEYLTAEKAIEKAKEKIIENTNINNNNNSSSSIVFNITNTLQKTTKSIKQNIDLEVAILSYLYFALVVVVLLTNVSLPRYVKFTLYLGTAIITTLAKSKIKKGPVSKWFVNTIKGADDLWNVEDIFSDENKK